MSESSTDHPVASLLLLPDQVESTSPIGGKAKALAALTRAGLPVPDWFVILPTAFYASLSEESRISLEREKSVEAIRQLLDRITPSGDLLMELDKAVALLCPAGGLVSVRSSAAEEDSAAQSFAGQLESFLFVAPSDVPDRVVRVWGSGFSERIVAYRQEAGLGLIPMVPAVLIQRMIEADCAGVAFSADPVTGRRGVTVVTAVWGLGSALVAGEVDADTWRVDRAGHLLEKNISTKLIAHERDAQHVEGVRVVRLPPELSARPVLTDEQVRAVAELARAAERLFGKPQDIEWGMAKGELFILQSRPITTLAGKPDPDAHAAIWDNSNIAESYSGVTTPLTFSFARRAYAEVYRQFARVMGLPEHIVRERHDIFGCMLGLVRGRVYYNLLNWYRLLALLPGFKANRVFMEQMLGLREPMPDLLIQPGGFTTVMARAKDSFRLVATMSKLAFNYLTIDRRVTRFYRLLDEVLGTGQPDLSTLRPEELTRDYRDIEERLITQWDAPIVNDFFTMIFHGLLRKFALRWLRDGGEMIANDLLCGEGGMISGEPARRVRTMAELALQRTDFIATLCGGSLAAIQSAIRRFPAFQQEYEGYLDRFGDRCMEELKLESPTLRDDPLPLLRSVGQFARKAQEGLAPVSGVELELRRRAEMQTRKGLRFKPLKQAIFSWVLRNARHRVRDRENLRFQRTRVFGRARLIAIEIGRRLAALDLLKDHRDVFYLEEEELLSFVEGQATTTDLKGLIALRKREFEGYRATVPPADRFETRGIVYVGHTFQPTETTKTSEGDQISGVACCPGIVRGPVRVISDCKDAQLAPGEIIVAKRTDPGWVMIFPAAAGLLVECGSLLSHSAIVAREIGLPTIVSLPGLTGWIRNGEWVEMNGSTGQVVKRSAPTSRSEEGWHGDRK